MPAMGRLREKMRREEGSGTNCGGAYGTTFVGVQVVC